MSIAVWFVRRDFHGNVLYGAAIGEADARAGGSFLVELKTHTITLDVKPGLIVNGTRLRIPKQGEEPTVHGPRGDLFLEFSIRRHKVRQADNGLIAASTILIIWIAGAVVISATAPSTVNAQNAAMFLVVPVGAVIYLVRRLLDPTSR